jgi:hypothetical protein
MIDEQPKEPTRPAIVQGKVTSESSTETAANASALDKESDISKLTAEEQLARFEKELKENDWGHQPC